MAKVNSSKYPVYPIMKPKLPMTKPNITYARPLYYISLITGLSCPINMTEYCARSGTGHKVYTCLMILAIIAANAFSLRGRLSTSYTFLIQTVIITDIIQQIVLLISNIYSIVHILFCGEAHVQRYFDFLKQIDIKLITTMNLKRKKCIFRLQLMVSHIVLIFLCSYDFWTWTQALGIGIQVFQFYVFRLYSYYLSLVTVFQIYTFANALKVRFEMLNERLFDVSIDWLGNVQTNESLTLRDLFLSYKKSSVEMKASGLSLPCLIKMHDLLCDVIGLVNDAFGMNIVLLVCQIIVNSVVAFNLTLIFSTGVQPASGSGYIHLIALNVSWAIFFMGMGVAIARSCDNASKEAWRAATISYKLLVCIPVESTIKKDRETRILLNQLASQIEHRRPAFDAYGFFPVNHSMLYAIIGAVSSYIVIIIQFNNSPILTNVNHLNKTQT